MKKNNKKQMVIKKIVKDIDQQCFFIYFTDHRWYSRIDFTKDIKSEDDAIYEYNNFFKI